MDRNDFLQFQSDADRLGTDPQYLQRFYSVAPDWNIPRDEAEDLLRDWQGPRRALFRTDTERALLFRGVVLRAKNPPNAGS